MSVEALRAGKFSAPKNYHQKSSASRFFLQKTALLAGASCQTHWAENLQCNDFSVRNGDGSICFASLRPQLPNLSFFSQGCRAEFKAFMAAITLSWMPAHSASGAR
jgi:hypothetical protein